MSENEPLELTLHKEHKGPNPFDYELRDSVGTSVGYVGDFVQVNARTHGSILIRPAPEPEGCEVFVESWAWKLSGSRLYTVRAHIDAQTAQELKRILFENGQRFAPNRMSALYASFERLNLGTTPADAVAWASAGREGSDG